MCVLLVLSIGRPAGGVEQAAKESLLQMRGQRDRLSAASSTSVTAHASASVRSLPRLSQQLEASSSGSVVHVAKELTRYVLDDEDLSAPVDSKTSGSPVVGATSSDPRDLARALQHQQLRAEVIDNTFNSCYFSVTCRHPASEWWGADVVICLERGADLHITQLIPCHSLSLASVKSRLVLPFWYRLT